LLGNIGWCCELGMELLKQVEMAIKGIKKGKLLSNCGRKMAITFLPVRKAKN